jgi:hypothetical protein
MKTEIKFTEPKLVAIGEVMETLNKVEELIVTLNYPIWGDVMVKIWKDGNTYKYFDKDAPIKVRSFDTIDQLMWEYELPKTLKPYLEKL